MHCRSILLLLFLLLAAKASAQVVINEICAANADIIMDPQYDTFSAWVELYNHGGADANVGFWHISDDPAEPNKWRLPVNAVVPAHGYLLIWCDNRSSEYHTNFSLSGNGETVVLSSSTGELVDQLQFPSQTINFSYGRLPNGGAETGHMDQPTPAKANIGTATASGLSKVSFNPLPGRYNGTLSVTLANADPSASIHYTIDGSEPTINSPHYSAPFTLTATATVKARAFREGYVGAKTAIATYFLNEHSFTMPVVALSTTPAYLWDDYIGIYTDGKRGASGNCQTQPKNWNQDWDRHAHFEYFLSTGEKKFGQAVDIRIGGACSRAFPQKSFVVRARGKYGKSTLDEPFFVQKDINKYGALFLRNSGNDFNTTSFRDALLQLLPVGQMDIDYMAYQPSVLYLNGQYWGIQSLREKIDGDFIQTNYGVSKDDLDLLENGGFPIEGDGAAWYGYLDSLKLVNRTSPTAFSFIDKHIDVQEYINYMVSELYYANTDWPGNNVKYWRQRSTHGKFRWIFWDTDFGFGLYPNMSWAEHPTLTFATDPNSGVGWPNPSWSTEHFRLLLENPVFKSRFIQTLYTAMETTFKPARVNHMIDSLAEQLSSEMYYHKQRWGGTTQDWNFEVQRMRDFANQRHVFMPQHAARFFKIGANRQINLAGNSSTQGTIRLNGVNQSTPVTLAYPKGLVLQAEAVAQPGYVFTHWDGQRTRTQRSTLVMRGDSWKYFDQGIQPGSNWMSGAFTDNNWSAGPAELGYGDGDEQTVVNAGPDPANKFITTYFRKTISLADTTGLQQTQGSIKYDDAAAVYVNGTEVFRENLPAGTLAYNTLALQGVVDENAWHAFVVPRGLLVPGTNVVAVEIHQSAVTSSDISFDLELTAAQTQAPESFSSTTAALTDTTFADITLVAHFVADTRAVTGLYINEFSAQSPAMVYDVFGEAEDWIELINAGADTINLAGLFISDNLNLPRRHQLTKGNGKEMLLAPGAFKVLWADQQITQGADHVNFKLSADGEEIGLYQVLGTQTIRLDATAFNPQPFNSSFSRIPDATGPFVLTAKITPREPNQLAGITGLDNHESLVSVFPNPASSQCVVRARAPIESVQVSDLLGQSVSQTTGNGSEQLTLSTSHLPDGVFLIRVLAGGETAVVRLVVAR